MEKIKFFTIFIEALNSNGNGYLSLFFHYIIMKSFKLYFKLIILLYYQTVLTNEYSELT
jgi:hypothetical protein